MAGLVKRGMDAVKNATGVGSSSSSQQPQQGYPASSYPPSAPSSYPTSAQSSYPTAAYPTSAGQPTQNYPQQNYAQGQQPQHPYTATAPAQQTYATPSQPAEVGYAAGAPPPYTNQQPAAQPAVNYPVSATQQAPPVRQQQGPLRLGQKIGLLPSFVRGTYQGSTPVRPELSPLNDNPNHPRRKKSVPAPWRPANPNEVRHGVPIQTILGIENGVGDCIAIAAKKLKDNRPNGWEDNSCYMDLGKATNEALKMNLCCGCYLGAYVLARFFLAILAAPIVAVANVLVGVLLIVPTTILVYSEIVCKAKCIGPVAKICTILGTPILTCLALVTIILWSLGNGFLIPFEYCMAESFQLMMMGPYSFLTNGYTKRKESLAYYNQNELPYWEIRIWAPFTALLGVVLGLAFGCVSFLLIQLCLSPKLLFSLWYQLWSEPMDPNRERRDPNGDPCYQLCMCCYESCLDLCMCFTILFRIFMTFAFFLGVVLMIPISVVYGLFAGAVAGSEAWNDPAAIFTGPWRATVKYYNDILEWADLH